MDEQISAEQLARAMLAIEADRKKVEEDKKADSHCGAVAKKGACCGVSCVAAASVLVAVSFMAGRWSQNK